MWWYELGYVSRSVKGLFLVRPTVVLQSQSIFQSRNEPEGLK
jgi:hypothetical protein